MGIGKKLLGWLGLRLARMLAPQAASPIILAATLAFAAFGAAALSPATAHPATSQMQMAPSLLLDSPRTFCEAASDGDGHTICHVLASQVDTVPNLGCYADPDGDGTFICYYATDPTASN